MTQKVLNFLLHNVINPIIFKNTYNDNQLHWATRNCADYKKVFRFQYENFISGGVSNKYREARKHILKHYPTSSIARQHQINKYVNPI